MSVYRRPGAQTFSYDFRLRSHRFSGDTGETEKRRAEAVERLKRAEAAARLAETRSLDAPDTWHAAVTRYFDEVGQHHRNWPTTLNSLEWLTAQLGKQMPLAAIDDNRVAQLVARRRVEPSRRSKRAGPLSAATVNRTVTEPLRKVLHRARHVWKVKTADIAWRTHLLAEPRERVREASTGEEAKLLAHLARGYDDAVRFGFLSGCRRAEICALRWTDVDFFGRRFTVTGKGNKRATLPMGDAIFALLFSLRDQHPDFVFSFVALKTRRELGQVRGRRYPIQPTRLSHVLLKAARDAGIVDFHLHDTRHTAATRVLRASNLRVVQHLLRHEDVSTTAKYAHALTDDIRNALNAASVAQTTGRIDIENNREQLDPASRDRSRG